MDRAARLKLALWLVIGFAFPTAIVRLLFGLGATTRLSDTTPWGLWVGFDLSAVALAAGGFVLTATVHIFRLERFHTLVRLVVLAAFLTYLSFSAILVFELGLPWRIWYMTIYWNHHSPLFEVGWCVMLYTAVLALEFFPVPAEEVSALARIRRFLLKMRLPLVITGIALSTLHQSSLGSLFLIVPYRLHPLWYSPVLPVLFFISAVAAGLMMAVFASCFTAYFYRRKSEPKIVGPLASAARWFLLIYFFVRIGDLAIRGQLFYLLQRDWRIGLFCAELVLMVLLPVALFSSRRFAGNPAWQWAAATLGLSGVVLNRIDVGGLVNLSRGLGLYFPSWNEIAISLGIVAGAGLVFPFMIEHFKVWQERPSDPQADPRSLPEFDLVDTTWMGVPAIAARTKYSLAFVLAAAVGVSFLPSPKAAALGIVPTPAYKSRGSYEILFLDAGLSGYGVTFNHQKEIDRNGGKQSCAICHHMNLPGDKNSGCYECHSDMYLSADSFRHDWHASASGAKLACGECHAKGQTRNALNTKPCADCHKHLIPSEATIKIKTYAAPAYVDAMHELCIGCHVQVAMKEKKPELARCGECHGGKSNLSDDKNLLSHRRASAGRLVVLPPVISK